VWCIPVAWIVQQFSEWAIHKYILHPWGKKKGSFFHYHWEHHNRCRKNNNIDQEYIDMFNGKFSPMVKKELWLILALNLTLALPTALFMFVPYGICVALWQWLYFFLHAMSHTTNSRTVPTQHSLDSISIVAEESDAGSPGWLPWHDEHHMGKDQNLNWCVTSDWPDRLFKTRTK
jgi:hypothetical protein